jgi:DUF1365 family protein
VVAHAVVAATLATGRAAATAAKLVATTAVTTVAKMDVELGLEWLALDLALGLDAARPPRPHPRLFGI